MLSFSFRSSSFGTLVLLSTLALGACASSDASDTESGTQDVIIGGKPRLASTRVDALIGQVITKTKGFNPTAPILFPKELPVKGLVPISIAGEGGKVGYMISFDPSAHCQSNNGCGTMWLRADENKSGKFQAPGKPTKKPVHPGVVAIYDPQGGAHANASISWMRTAPEGHPEIGIEYSINFAKEAVAFTEDEMIAFASSAIEGGSRRPVEIQMSLAFKANSKPLRAPIVYPPNLPVGGLFPGFVQETEAGYTFGFALEDKCEREGCLGIWLDVQKFEGEFSFGDPIAISDEVKAVYDPEGGAHGNASIRWTQASTADSEMKGLEFSINFHSENLQLSREELVGFAKAAINQGMSELSTQ